MPEQKLEAIVTYISKNHPEDLIKLLRVYSLSEIRGQVEREFENISTDAMQEEQLEAKKRRLLIRNVLVEMETCTEYGTEAEREEQWRNKRKAIVEKYMQDRQENKGRRRHFGRSLLPEKGS